MESFYNASMLDYQNYTWMFRPGKETIPLSHEWRLGDKKLKFIRIFWDTPIFNKITRDKAAKFVDQLSTIGGTMGLLTGFSIISGIEIIYFILKLFLAKLTKI